MWLTRLMSSILQMFFFFNFVYLQTVLGLNCVCHIKPLLSIIRNICCDIYVKTKFANSYCSTITYDLQFSHVSLKFEKEKKTQNEIKWIIITKCLCTIKTVLFFNYLPPQILLVLRSHGRQHVIRVHANVHEIIQDIWECCVSTCKMSKNARQKKHRVQDAVTASDLR